MAAACSSVTSWGVCMSRLDHAFVIAPPDTKRAERTCGSPVRVAGSDLVTRNGAPKGSGRTRPDDLRRAVAALPEIELRHPEMSDRERRHLVALAYLADEALVRRYWQELSDGRLISSTAASPGSAVAHVDCLAESIRKAAARKTSRLAEPEAAKCLVCNRPADYLLSLRQDVGGVDANVGVCREHCGEAGADALLSHGVRVTYGPCSRMPQPKRVRALGHGNQWSRIVDCSSINGNEYGGLELAGPIVLADDQASVGSNGEPTFRCVQVVARVFLVAQGHIDLSAVDAVLARVPSLLFRAFFDTPEEAARRPPEDWLKGIGTECEYLAVSRPGLVGCGDPKPRSASRRQRDAAKKEQSKGRAMLRSHPLVIVRALRASFFAVPASASSGTPRSGE